MKIILVLLLCLGLVGCATFGQMQRGLNALQGRNVQTAFDVLGYPSGKQEFGSDTVYYWQVNSSGTILLPQTSTTSGYVGMTPVYGSTTYNQVVPVNYNCLIKLITDEKGIIKTWEYNGNYGGCASYIKRLNQYYNQSNESKNHGWLGIAYRDLTEDLAKDFGLSDKNGVMVEEVLKDGPAQKSGMEKKDIIKQIDNKPINHAYEFTGVLKNLSVGEKIKATVIRNKKIIDLDIITGERPRN